MELTGVMLKVCLLYFPYQVLENSEEYPSQDDDQFYLHMITDLF